MWRFCVLLLAAVASAQNGPSAKPGSLELRIEGENVLAGVPQDFTFRLVNHTNHDVLLPKPELQCSGSRDGEIRLRLSAPMEASPRSLAPKGGCVKEYAGRPAITDAIKTWQTLHSGESLTLTSGGHAMLFYDDLLPGRYVFSATYTPPPLTTLEQQILRQMGVEFASRPLTSNRLSFVAGK